MGANMYLGNKRKSDYLGAERRLDLAITKLKYNPTVRRISEFSYKVCSQTDPFLDFTVVFFGRDMSSCNCEARIICIHIIAAEREKDLPIETGATDVVSVGGGMVFHEKDRRDPDRGVRPVVRCGCGAVATIGNRCKSCEREFQDNMDFSREHLEKVNAEIFG